MSSKLTTIYQTLVELADRTGRDQRAELKGGAHLAVRVTCEGVTIVSISRPDKKLGDVELTTFKAHFGIPTEATRTPAEGQHAIDRNGTIHHTVVWSWRAVPVKEESR